MADTSSQRIPSGPTIADDDPFAELTRIMGFDPRVKVYQPEPAEPDFGIDLERELMGEFSDDQDNQPLIGTASDDVATAQDSSAFEPEPVATQPEAPHLEQPVATEPAQDLELDLSTEDLALQRLDRIEAELQPASDELFFDEATPAAAEPVEPELQAVAEPTEPQPVAAEEQSFDDFDALFSQEITPAAEAVAPAASDEVDEIEQAYAALEAWENSLHQSTEQSVPAPSPETDESFQGSATFEPEPVLAASVEPSVSYDLGDLELSLDETEVVQPTGEAALQAVWLDNQDEVERAKDEVARAYAALDAWEKEHASASVEANEDQTESAVGGRWEEPRSELVAEDPDARGTFTAEEGWTDEFTVSLDEPQVLSPWGQDASVEQIEPADQSAELEDDRDLLHAESANLEDEPQVEDFERQLFDLLDGEFSDEQATQPERADDANWFDDEDFAELVAPEQPQTDAESFASSDSFEPSAQPASAEASDSDRPWQAEVPVAAGAPVVASAFAGSSEPEFQPLAPAQPTAADDEPDLGDFELAELFAEDLSKREQEAAAAADDADNAVSAQPTGIEANEAPNDIAEPDHFSAAALQPAVEPPAPPQMEPDAMQPFDERAFDLALADELAEDTYRHDSNGRDDHFSARTMPSSSYSERPRASINAPSMHREVPDIETVDFVDGRLAHSDDLDLPEVDYGRDQPRASDGFDDFDAEFVSAFNSLNDESAPQPAREEPAAQRAAGVHAWDDNFDLGMAGVAAGSMAGASAASSLSRAGLYEPQEEEDFVQSAPRQQRSAAPARRRGLLMAGAAAAIVLIGGVAMIALPGGSGENGAPAVLRADTDPMKVRPENPGGATVPNQDNVVYDRVGSGQPLGAPTQERLISTDEAPVDLAAQEQDEAAMDSLAALDPEGSDIEDIDEDPVGTATKAEDRLTPQAADASQQVPQEMIAVAPRKVRTMVVRPDGTLAPREEEPTAAAEPTVASAAEAAISAEPTSAAPAAPAAAPLAEPAQSAVAEAPMPAAPAPARPEPAPQMAALEPATAPTAAPEPIEAAAAPPGWAVQIASQPSEASAKSSLENLSRRYASVLNGRSLNIVKAEIAGKGTYYRVRVPAGSRAEANTICSNLKSAGGSCFVSQ